MESINFPEKGATYSKSVEALIQKIKTKISDTVEHGDFKYYVSPNIPYDSSVKGITVNTVNSIIKNHFIAEGYDVLESGQYVIISWDMSESTSPDIQLHIENSLEALIKNIKNEILRKMEQGEFLTSYIHVPVNKVLYDKVYNYLTSKGYTVIPKNEQTPSMIHAHITVTWAY